MEHGQGYIKLFLVARTSNNIQLKSKILFLQKIMA